MDFIPPGSSVHGISQARILEWVAMPSSRGSSMDWPCVSYVSCTGRRVLHQGATRGTSHPTWGSTFCAGRRYLSPMDALLILPVPWHLDPATFLGGALPHFEWVPKPHDGPSSPALCGCLFAPLFGLWYLQLSATNKLHWYVCTTGHLYTILLICHPCSLSLSSPPYGLTRRPLPLQSVLTQSLVWCLSGLAPTQAFWIELFRRERE